MFYNILSDDPSSFLPLSHNSVLRVLFFPCKISLLTSSPNPADLRVNAPYSYGPPPIVVTVPSFSDSFGIVSLLNSDILNIYPVTTAAPDLEAQLFGTSKSKHLKIL